jgi:hypothetical protein
MNSLVSRHRVALDLVTTARPSRQRSGAILSGLICPGSPSRRRSQRNHDCERARSENRSDKKEWAP